MNNELLNKIVDLENKINNLEMKKKELQREADSEFINDGDEFYKALIGKCFLENGNSNHFYIPLKYKGYSNEQYKFILKCGHLYYDNEYVMYNVIDLHSMNPHDFKRLYNIQDKQRFVDAVKKATDNILNCVTY